LAMLCNPQNSMGGDQQLAVQCQPPEETEAPHPPNPLPHTLNHSNIWDPLIDVTPSNRQ
jgi:hypothetical protein